MDVETTPALAHLVGTYFHQDWFVTYGSIAATVQDFVRGSPSDAPALARDIDLALATYPTEESLEAYLDELGTDYQADPATGGYRAWLVELGQLTEKALA